MQSDLGGMLIRDSLDTGIFNAEITLTIVHNIGPGGGNPSHTTSNFTNFNRAHNNHFRQGFRCCQTQT